MVQFIHREADTTTLNPTELQNILHKWNTTDADFPHFQSIHQLFEAQVKQNPNAVAVVHEQHTLTYSELNTRANQLAHYLQNLGIGAEVPVTICVERSHQLIIGLLGILKAGGAYVPLDPAYPLERLAFMLEDAQAPVLLTQEHLLDKLPTWAQVICLDTDWESISKESKDNLEHSVNVNNLAYIIYTSGSTGQPKGVEVEHLGLVNLVTWHQRAYSITPSDRATQIASPAFDASVWEIWTYLTAGASLYIVPESIRSDTPALLEWLADTGITITFLPTPLAEAVLNSQLPPYLQLRYLLTGGDQLHPVSVTDLPFVLVNHYGPTENTVVATAATINHHNQISPPIGRPIANTQIYILNSQQQPVEIGEPGELHISGVGLARGYRNQPQLTAQKFIAHPFNDIPDARLYKTGDLARYRSDGNIEFLGRIDNQVKIRGFRIELGDIESALTQHPAVQQSIVISQDDKRDKQLVGYVTLKPRQTTDTKQLRAFLQSKLPNYMIPSAVVILDQFPLTPNGKIDRRALPLPEHKITHTDTELARTNLEEVIAAIFAEVLELESIGIEDDFFELGGHSLLATEILAKIYELLAVDLRLGAIFENPTVASLSQTILQNHENPAAVEKTAQLLLSIAELPDDEC